MNDWKWKKIKNKNKNWKIDVLNCHLLKFKNMITKNDKRLSEFFS
jgi:hypothetical protein